MIKRLLELKIAVILILILSITSCVQNRAPSDKKETVKTQTIVLTGLNPTTYINQEIGFGIHLPQKWQYDKEGSQEVTFYLDKELGHHYKAVAFSEAENDQFPHGMFILVEPTKEIPATEPEQTKHFQFLLERFESKFSQTQVIKIDGHIALRCIFPQTKSGEQLCFYHCTRIFTGEKMFEIIFMVPESFRTQYESILDRSVETFRVIH
ncbi:MAG: PsbP-related protein [Planctomycetota bacterium]